MPRANRRLTRHAWLLLILLVAAGLRLYGLNNLSPPGLEHDEVANWLIDQDILAGNHAVYFSAAYGHEAGFHYWQTLFVRLVGDHALALRLPAALAGLLLVAVTYALLRQLWGDRTALLAAGLLAVLFWPVFYSRLGLRAIMLPLVGGLSAYAWWAAWRPRARPTVQLTLAGALAGLSLYTYLAARAVPIFYGLYVLYLVVWHRPVLRGKGRGLVGFWLALIVVALPLALFLSQNPGSEFRVDEVSAPLQALLAGDPRPALLNSLKILGLFGWRGDPLWRQNVAPQPVFALPMALLFYGGLLLALRRWRDRRYAYALLWLFSSAIPSIVTIDAPSSIRISNILPFLVLLPADFIHSFRKLSPERAKLSTVWRRQRLILGFFGLLLLLSGGRTIYYQFIIWPKHEEVRFVWQADLTAAAAYLDADSAAGPVAIGGWSPATMDPPTMDLTLRRTDLSLRFFDPGSGLIIPAGANPRLLHPTALPLAPPLAAALIAAGAQVQVDSPFTLYAFAGSPQLAPARQPSLADFDGELGLQGYELTAEAGAWQLLTYWQVGAAPAGERRLFLHLVDADGALVAQADQLAAPAAYWQAGDQLLQLLTVTDPGGAGVALRLGVYDPQTGRRLPLPDGADYLTWPLP